MTYEFFLNKHLFSSQEGIFPINNNLQKNTDGKLQDNGKILLRAGRVFMYMSHLSI